jgi:ABC-type multidrug transport system ATPase subunit
MHTAEHLVSKCLAGDLARDRTIILVTHHITFCLSAASYLIEISRGKVIRQGTIQELQDLDLLQNVIARENEPLIEDQIEARTPENEANALDPDAKLLKKQGNGKLVDAESRAEGRVSWRTYVTYMRAAGFVSWFLTVMLMLLIRFINIGNQVISKSSTCYLRLTI